MTKNEALETKQASWLTVNNTFLVLLLLAVFAWTFYTMSIRWNQENSYYSHGWLIPPVCAFLLYRKRKDLIAAPKQPSRWGLALLIPSLFLHLLGSAWRVGFFSGFALLGTLIGVVLTLYGWRTLRVALFPLLFLLFMIPLPEFIVELASFRMKLLSARVATVIVQTFGIPAVRDGSFIYLPNDATLVVDDVCSGLKYLISLMAFGALYAYISKVKGWKTWALFAMAIPISFLANVARVTLMVIVGYWRGVEEVGKWYFHDFFGFLLFVVAFVLLFFAESLMLGRDRNEAEESDEAGSPALVSFQRPRLRQGVYLCLAVTAALTTYLVWPREAPLATDVLKAIPLKLNGWEGSEYTLSDRTYDLLGTRDALSRGYRNKNGDGLQLILVMAQQAKRRTHPPEQCMTGEGYEIQSATETIINVRMDGKSVALPVRELILKHGEKMRMAWYFFKSGDHLSSSYWQHQAGIAIRKFAHPNEADIMVRIDRDVRRSMDEERETVNSFLQEVVPHIMLHLP